jgi:hypothetical protein
MSKDITVDAYKFDAVFRRMPTKELSATPKASFAIGLTPHDKVDATGGAQLTHCSSSKIENSGFRLKNLVLFQSSQI